MDYKKLHKDTITKLQQMVNSGKITVETACGICADFVPESDDERIRKMIINTLNRDKILTEDEAYDCVAWLEKQGEQKLADKVEPKFHEGEWLCENEPNNYARFIQILEIVNVQGKDRYRISRDIHKDEDVVEFDFVEKYYHKFDIKDAKEGDVLFIEIDSSTCIFKKLEGNLLYSYIISDGKLLVEDSHYYYETSDNVYPATKEQRDTLMKAMTDAGYAFIEKACEWLDENLLNNRGQINANDTDEFIKKFRKAMKL